MSAETRLQRTIAFHGTSDPVELKKRQDAFMAQWAKDDEEFYARKKAKQAQQQPTA